MTKTYTWKTPRGAQIEATIRVEHETTAKTSADGWEMEVKCDSWFRIVEDMKVNGRATKMMELTKYGDQDCIMIDKAGKDKVLVAIPADVVEDLFGEERRTEKAIDEANDRLEEKMEAHRKAVYNMMMGNRA